MSTTDSLLDHARARAATGSVSALPSRPARHVAVVACMDARLDVAAILGLSVGDAHVVRNAGGVVTDDVMRSLAVSQRLLGTTEVVLVHHTDCGMLTFTDDAFASAIEAETGVRPAWSAQAFTDLDEDVRRGAARIRAESALPHRGAVRGFVYDVATGELREVA